MSRTHSVSVTEPHPSLPTTTPTSYLPTGRGGAGNYARYPTASLTAGPTATGPASRISLTKPFKRNQPPTSTFYGRGGAGNSFRKAESEERVFQFDEEMVRTREVQSPVYHIGRGGAANWVDESKSGSGAREMPRTERVNSTASAVSSSSEGSVGGSAAKRSGEGAFSKLARRFS